MGSSIGQDGLIGANVIYVATNFGTTGFTDHVSQFFIECLREAISS